MDFQLHCNSLDCRAFLTSRAVVTTCSHIFCESCASKYGLADSRNTARSCPACGDAWTTADNATLTSLSPSEDYKTSVLSGLSPTTILECASRGAAFFQYQIVQEFLYQGHVAKNLADQYHILDNHLDKVISDANGEIAMLRNKLAASQDDYRSLERKNTELIDAFKAKSAAHNKLRQMYQRLHAQAGEAAVQDAAAMNVEEALHPTTLRRDLPVQRPARAHMVGQRSPNIFVDRRRATPTNTSRPLEQPVLDDFANPHRQRTGLSPYSNAVAGIPAQTGRLRSAAGSISHPTPLRQPLRGIDVNVGDPGRSGLDRLGPGTRNGTTSMKRGQGPGQLNLGASLLGLR